MAQELVGAPIFGEFDGSASEVAVILLELRLKAAEQGEGVGRGTGESGDNLVVVQAADLFGRMLDDRLAKRDLAVAGENDVAIASNGQNCCGSNQSFRSHERNS